MSWLSCSLICSTRAAGIESEIDDRIESNRKSILIESDPCRFGGIESNRKSKSHIDIEIESNRIEIRIEIQKKTNQIIKINLEHIIEIESDRIEIEIRIEISNRIEIEIEIGSKNRIEKSKIESTESDRIGSNR